MLTTKTMTLTVVLLLSVCMAYEVQIRAMPMKPDKSATVGEWQNYLRKWIEHYDQSSGRYGKRFSPPLVPREPREPREEVLSDEYQTPFKSFKFYENYT